MKKPKLKSVIIASLVLIYLGLYLPKLGIKRSFFSVSSKAPQTQKFDARCTRVIDGDTIEVVFIGKEKPYSDTQKIRFIGCNTPELNLKKKEDAEYWSKEAAFFTKNELENQYIKLSFDNISDKKDKYGRLLCYVWVDDFLFNQILIESGNARFYPNFQFNSDYMELFNKAEQYARLNSMGMWKNEQ